MEKLQIMVDGELAQELKASAKKAGLPLSSFARLILQSGFKNRLSSLEKSLLDTDGDVHCTGQEFLDELDKMIENA